MESRPYWEGKRIKRNVIKRWFKWHTAAGILCPDSSLCEVFSVKLGELSQIKPRAFLKDS